MDVRVLLRVLALSLLLLIPLGVYFIPNVVAGFFGFLWALAPLWLPLLLTALFIPLWLTYVRSQYVASVPYVMLELKPGEHTPKTAHPMEIVFYSLYYRESISRTEELLAGRVRLPWSFEIAATGGTVRFFVRIPKAHRQAFELRLRSEYKDVDIDEPRDYAREVAFSPVSMKLAAREFTLLKPDPYPLKTYESYEKEKDQSGPFHALLDSLISLPEKQHLYISFIVRPHQRERKHFWQREVDSLHTDATHEIGKIIGDVGDPRQLPKTEQEIIAAIEDALKRPSFDCGVRALYMADRDVYDEARAEGLDTLFDQFSDPKLNGFSAYNPRERISWPLSDIFAAIPWLYEAYVLNLYRRRTHFTPPYYGKVTVLNTAELATLFHLPHITRSSALSRVHGTRLEPPDNIPL
ncbi:MAG: hypothetical protein AAB439_03630 [Patescibacteria group bacterium]